MNFHVYTLHNTTISTTHVHVQYTPFIILPLVQLMYMYIPFVILPFVQLMYMYIPFVILPLEQLMYISTNIMCNVRNAF